jgi:hypothetical protein
MYFHRIFSIIWLVVMEETRARNKNLVTGPSVRASAAFGRSLNPKSSPFAVEAIGCTPDSSGNQG